jgi:hypothetical protein
LVPHSRLRLQLMKQCPVHNSAILKTPHLHNKSIYRTILALGAFRDNAWSAIIFGIYMCLCMHILHIGILPDNEVCSSSKRNWFLAVFHLILYCICRRRLYNMGDRETGAVACLLVVSAFTDRWSYRCWTKRNTLVLQIGGCAGKLAHITIMLYVVDVLSMWNQNSLDCLYREVKKNSIGL